LELAWRNKIIDFAFPYIIQYVRDLNARVDALEHVGKAEEVDKKKEKAPEGFQVPPNPNDHLGVGMDGMGIGGPYGGGYGYGGAVGIGGAPALALMPPPGSMPGFGVPVGGGYPVPDYSGLGGGLQPQYDPSQYYGGFQS